MSDPTEKKPEVKPIIVDDPIPEVPITAAEVENKALRDSQFANFKAARGGQATAVLPFGVRIDASKHVKARYDPTNMADIFSNAESLIKDEFKRAHPGWHYAWPLATGTKTQAYIRANWFKPVPWNMIDTESRPALVMPDPTNERTVLGQHVLVAVPPEIWDREYGTPVDEAIGRTAMNRQRQEAELEAAFGKHGYKGEYSVTDVRQER